MLSRHLSRLPSVKASSAITCCRHPALILACLSALVPQKANLFPSVYSTVMITHAELYLAQKPFRRFLSRLHVSANMYRGSEAEHRREPSTPDNLQHLLLQGSKSKRRAVTLAAIAILGFLAFSLSKPRSVTDLLSSPASSSRSKTAEDGLLYYQDQSTTHPITQLIEEAQTAWNSKLNRQSKTLEQAVANYVARYGRRPPRGFDQWFAWAKERDVIIIDDFDQIYTDIAPFLAIPPDVLRKRLLEVSEWTGAYHLVNVKDHATKTTEKGGREELLQQLMASFIHLLPDMTIALSRADGPSLVVEGDFKSSALDTFRNGQYLSPAEYESRHNSVAFPPWAMICPSASRLRRHTSGLEFDTRPIGHSFIVDHPKVMDFCAFPEYLDGHGFTQWRGPTLNLLYPVFASSKTSFHSDIAVTPLDQYHRSPPELIAWSDKSDSRVLWRGWPTGTPHTAWTNWRSSTRDRLVQFGADQQGYRSTRMPIAEDGMSSVNASTADLVERYLDFAFVGLDISSGAEQDGTVAVMEQLYQIKEMMGPADESNYKFIMDVDGNAWSGRFHRLMRSNSVLFKSTMFTEWWSSRIQPWYHYIPIKPDYSDILDITAYFTGDLQGQNGHDAAAERIAANAREWSDKHDRMTDMSCYMF